MFEFTYGTCNNRGNVYFDLISCEKWPHDKQEIKRDLNIHIYYSSLSFKRDKLQSTIAIFSQKDRMEFMVLENLGKSSVVMIFRDLITICEIFEFSLVSLYFFFLLLVHMCALYQTATKAK